MSTSRSEIRLAISFRREFAVAQAGHRHVEVVAEVAVVLLDGLDQRVVGRHPDRAAPVGIAAEQAGVGLARHVLDHRPADAGHMAQVAAARRGCARRCGCRSATGTRPRPAGGAGCAAAWCGPPAPAGARRARWSWSGQCADVVAVEQAAAVLGQHRGEARRVLEQPLVDDLAGEQRDDADPGEHVDALAGAVGRRPPDP